MSEFEVVREHLDVALSLMMVGMSRLSTDSVSFVELKSIVSEVEYLRARLGDVIYSGGMCRG